MIVATILIVAACLGAVLWRTVGRRPPVRAAHTISPAWRDGRFRNVAITRAAGFADVIKAFWAHRGQRRIPLQPLPVDGVRSDVLSGPASQALQVTWLGHSSVLIEMDGLRLLTDPVLSARASPVPFAGPKRFTPPALTVDQLPPIDAVILSHDHYDHLDRDTIRALADRAGHFYTTLGVGQRLIAWGIDAARVTELDWWQETRFGSLTLAATPAQHFSGRGLGDRNSTLWASWVVMGKIERLFFSGDTGMHKEFAKIGERYGPFDLTLIECGAYSETWPDVHMQPEQSIAAHRLLRGKTMLPVHWGTFDLAFHRWDEPAERIRLLAAQQDVPLVQPQPGETVRPDSALQPPWWRAFEADAVQHPSSNVSRGISA